MSIAIGALVRTFWKPIAAVGALAVLYLALKLYGSIQYDRGMADCQAAQTLAELNEFKAQTERLGGISEQLEQAADTLRDAKPKIIERQTRVEIKNPLPVDCVIPADRLRISNDVINAANAARQPRQAVPADRTTDR